MILLLASGSESHRLICSPVKLISGDQYRLTFEVWGDTTDDISYGFESSGGLGISNTSETVPGGGWIPLNLTFTSTISDDESKLVIHLPEATNVWRFDNFKMINLTKEQTNYRVMRIQGKVHPGQFLQTLELREVTATETA